MNDKALIADRKKFVLDDISKFAIVKIYVLACVATKKQRRKKITDVYRLHSDRYSICNMRECVDGSESYIE
jgi:hypothetical protein